MQPMLIKLFFIMLFQTAIQALSQVTLKMGMQAINGFTWTWSCFYHQIFLNGWLQLAILLIIVANVIWFLVLKFFPLTYAYPLTALGFIFGMIAGIFILHETVIWTQWVGVALIVGGCFLLLR